MDYKVGVSASGDNGSRRFIGLIGNALTGGDILGCLWCVAIFALLLLAPGHCVGWVTNLMGFRKRGPMQQAAWSVALSFAVTPIAAVMLGKFSSDAVGWWVVMGCAVVMMGTILWAHTRDKDRRFRPRRLAGILLGLVWTGFVIVSLVDVAVGDRLYLSVTVFDHALRSAFVDAVMRTGIPPANPLYWPGHAAPMRYYYFWYVVTAAAAKLAGAAARQAIIASSVWAGFGMAAILALFCRHFLTQDGGDGEPVRRRWPRLAVALALLAVTGLDIVPAVVKAIIRLPTDPDMEWWSSDQVSSWMDSLLWVPHHIAGLICCLFGFLLVWMSKGLSVTQRVLCAVVAGVSFASAFGLSTWIPVAFAMVLFGWMLWVLVWEPESRPRVPVLLGAGLVAVLVLLPYLHELRAAPTSAAVLLSGSTDATSPTLSVAGNASHLLHFGIRRIIDISGVLALPWFAQHAHAGAVAGVVLRLLLLIPGYFTELGFYGLILVVALLALRRLQVDEAVRTSLFLAVAALVVSTCLRSTIIENNDFGWRSILIAQFFLLLLAVRWCEGGFEPVGGRMRSVMVAMLWIGVAGTVYQAVGLRLYLPVEDKLGRADVSGLAERAMALRQGFDAMGRTIPRTAVVQYDIAQPSDYFRFAQILEVRRQVADAVPGCASAFGGDPGACPGIEAGVRRLFSPATSSAEARAECGRLGVG